MIQGKVYWIRASHHTTTDEGYIGITRTSGRGDRIWSHLNKLKNRSHPNPILQNAYNKHSDLIVDILFTGSIVECAAQEHSLRPSANIGWNVLPGGGVPPSQKGKHWFTNGNLNVLAVECPDGYWQGKIQARGENHKFYGQKKQYQTVGFQKGHVPWHKGQKFTRNGSSLKGKTWDVIDGKRVWSK